MKSNSKSNFLKHLDFMLLDITCLVISFLLGYSIRFSSDKVVSIEIYRNLFLIVILINIILTFFLEPYRNVLKRDTLKELKISVGFVAISLLMIALYMFLYQLGQDFARLAIAYIYLFYFISSFIVRILWKKHLNNKAKASLKNGEKSLIIICKKNEVKDVVNNIENHNYLFHHISGICYIDSNSKLKKYKEYQLISNKDIINYISTNWVDEIFIACDYNLIPAEMMESFSMIGIPIHIKLNDDSILVGKEKQLDRLGSYNVITATNKIYDNWQLFLKKCMDILGGIVGSLITVLLIIIIGPIIYIKSPGNIFYVSERVGLNGKIFKFYKFRSMVLNADDLKEDLKKNNRIKDGMMFKIEDDPRIIPGIGKFIRKTSLDEFPQFFNVLKGDMSLVGTRPPTMDEWSKYTPYYRSRLSIKPGITGMWQVSGRSKITDFNEVVKLDNEYIDNWSIGLDCRLIFKTITNIFSRDEGAM